MSIDPNLLKYTYEHYELFPDDGKRHEIVDGGHFVNPAPNLKHQTISRRLQFPLYQQIELTGLGWVFDAPVDVQLTEYDIVQPDLVVVLEDRRAILTEKKIDGVPNLIIEILSSGNAAYDRKVKKQTYLRAKVPEYWIVDPDQETIEQLVLENGRYKQQASVGSRITLDVLDQVSVEVGALWE